LLDGQEGNRTVTNISMTVDKSHCFSDRWTLIDLPFMLANLVESTFTPIVNTCHITSTQAPYQQQSIKATFILVLSPGNQSLRVAFHIVHSI
jgi:hypothetical protein